MFYKSNPNRSELIRRVLLLLHQHSTAEVLRVLKRGEVSDRIKIQDENSAYACMLGGPSRKKLFICTSNDSRTNGRIEVIEVEFPGAGLP
ncbi:hypothetical protein ES703_73499 [subsurface metagenome]